MFITIILAIRSVCLYDIQSKRFVKAKTQNIFTSGHLQSLNVADTAFIVRLGKQESVWYKKKYIYKKFLLFRQEKKKSNVDVVFVKIPVRKCALSINVAEAPFLPIH